MYSLLHKALLLTTLPLLLLLAACSSEQENPYADVSPRLVEITFRPSLSATQPATRALTTVMGEQWEHEIQNLWVLLVRKNAAGKWTLRYKFHFVHGAAMDASPLNVDGGLLQTGSSLPLSYTTSAKTIEAGDYYPLYLANVSSGSALETELQALRVSDVSIEAFLRRILTTATGSEGLPSPSAYELRDTDPSSTVRLLATNAFRMDASTGLPVGQWPGFSAVTPVSLTTSSAVSAELYRSLAKCRIFLRTTEKNGTFIPEAAGFRVKSVSVLNAPTHGYLIWNTRTPVGEASPAGAFDGYISPANQVAAASYDAVLLQAGSLLSAIHNAPISPTNVLDGTTAALNCYLKPDAEMMWSPTLPGTRRTPATMVRLVMERESVQTLTYDIPILPAVDPYPYLMANRCYDLHLCFRGPGLGIEVDSEDWTDEAAETLLFE